MLKKLGIALFYIGVALMLTAYFIPAAMYKLAFMGLCFIGLSTLADKVYGKEKSVSGTRNTSDAQEKYKFTGSISPVRRNVK